MMATPEEKQSKTKQTNNEQKKSEKTKNKQTKLTKTRNKKQMHVGLEGGYGTARGKCVPYIERAKSQNLPKMTHFCHDFFCSDEGRKWE